MRFEEQNNAMRELGNEIAKAFYLNEICDFLRRLLNKIYKQK